MSMSKCDVLTLHKVDSVQLDFNPKQRLKDMRATVRRWQATSRQRRQLKVLVENTDFLKDIGVSAGDAMLEANKPFWQE